MKGFWTNSNFVGDVPKNKGNDEVWKQLWDVLNADNEDFEPICYY